MPLKLSVGISKKVGLPNYSSLGASCNLDMELPHDTFTREPALFYGQLQLAYNACWQAVIEELERRLQSNGSTPRAESEPQCGNGQQHGNGQPNGNGQPPSRLRKATFSQVRALQAIARDQGLDLAQTLQQRYGFATLGDLTVADASELIDALKRSDNAAAEGT